MAIHLVWLKRDLRIRDHRPLFEASKRGQVMCLYVYEPELLNARDHDPSHLVFANQCLVSLRASLRRLGADPTIAPVAQVAARLFVGVDGGEPPRRGELLGEPVEDFRDLADPQRQVG
ncbi:MAG: deoxyribodipyrimidine photo-lyase, partial [Acidobacteriota bacterium]